jgi:integrase
MTSLHIMTFGAFSGLAATFPLLIGQIFGGFEGAPDPLAWAFWGPFVGSASRVLAGSLSDGLGGARVTHWAGLGMLVCTILVALQTNPTSLDSFPRFVAAMLALFFFAGLGNASTFKRMPMIFPPQQAGGVIGFTAAIGAYGPFILGLLLAWSFGSFGSAAPIFYGLAAFFLLRLQSHAELGPLHPQGRAFLAECTRIGALEEEGQQATPGTLGLLVQRYRGHEAFTDLAERTRSDHQDVFDYLQPIADTPLSRFTPPRIVRIRGKAGQDKGRRFGSYVKTVLSLVFAWGIERGYLASNPASKIKGIRKPRNAPQANRPWADAERYAVLRAAPPHLKLPIGLMMFTGMDPQEALRLPRSALDAGTIAIRRGKTSVPVAMPVIDELQAILDEAQLPDVGSLCLNSRGKPWTGGGFNASWRKLRLPLERTGQIRAGLFPKGLRHTVATILAEAGVDVDGIAAVLAHETSQMAKHYSRRADRARRVAGAIATSEQKADRSCQTYLMKVSNPHGERPHRINFRKSETYFGWGKGT